MLHLIQQLNDGVFDPKTIEDPFVFVQVYEGMTLLEHIAAQSSSIELLEQTLIRYIDIAALTERRRSVHEHSYSTFLYHYLFFFSEKVAGIRPDLKAIYINERLPRMIESLKELRLGDGRNECLRDSPRYFSFFSELERRIRSSYESPESHSLRSICLSSEIGLSIQSYGCLREINIDALSDVLIQMSKDPTYSSAGNSSLMGNLVTFISRRASYYAGVEPFSWSQTPTAYRLKCYAESLPLLMNQHWENYSPNQKQDAIEVLTILYREGVKSMQTDIATYLDSLIQKHENDFLLQRILLITLAPYPLGHAIPKLREKSPTLLSQLSPESNMLLMNSAASLITDEDDKLEYTDHINHLQSSNHPVNLTLTNKTRFHGAKSALQQKLAENFPQLSEASQWLAFLFCTGNFPSVERVKIFCGIVEGTDNRLMLALMGSDKLVLEYQTADFPDEKQVLFNWDYFHLFSSRASQFYLSFKYGSFFSNAEMLRAFLSHGHRVLRLHRDQDSRREVTLIDHAKHLNDHADALYCSISNDSIESCDFILKIDSISPGPLSYQSRAAMEHFGQILARHGVKYLDALNNKFRTPSTLPDTCSLDFIESYIISCQRERKIDQNQKGSWVIVGNSSDRYRSEYLYDLLVYPTRVELGHLSKLSCGDVKRANEMISKNDTPTSAPSLYFYACKAVHEHEKSLEGLSDEHGLSLGYLSDEQRRDVELAGKFKIEAKDCPFKLPF